ncbi:unnamed protein product [Eretmochelys imbricata]
MDGHDLPTHAQGWGGQPGLMPCSCGGCCGGRGVDLRGWRLGGIKEVVSKAAGVLAMGLEGVSRWQASWLGGGSQLGPVDTSPPHFLKSRAKQQAAPGKALVGLPPPRAGPSPLVQPL